ncbi:JAB domain-containing protein [Gallibacter intestinalis]|uniref:JAB domain-containing protein n=1 Tax=Gallibacter intestinalis TaxID=2779356 RepID=A0ABR9QZB0_9FIRM|nr:JAB domain-containing protein [Gallibacter intestinalis]MBE5036176.1 JAB domain-containing protein [Gallibacter intestinalis]
MEVKKYEIYTKTSRVWEVPNTEIKCSEDIYKFAVKYLKMQERDREVFSVVAINAKGQIIGVNDASIGDLFSAIMHPREILKYAILSNAAAIICIHNHPSGDPTPSQEDINSTVRLQDACEIIGIKLLDHIIVGENRYSSLKNEQLI